MSNLKISLILISLFIFLPSFAGAVIGVTAVSGSAAADLTECDINAGPGNISQGKIDLFDANLMMTNWLP